MHSRFWRIFWGVKNGLKTLFSKGQCHGKLENRIVFKWSNTAAIEAKLLLATPGEYNDKVMNDDLRTLWKLMVKFLCRDQMNMKDQSRSYPPGPYDLPLSGDLDFFLWELKRNRPPTAKDGIKYGMQYKTVGMDSFGSTIKKLLSSTDF
ncbi:uncharacterized protein LOC132283697 [Cornus florida]|uniref:uncharacterized protein LOC132283697 n=1 Tax=Cornus florida TaxID=4283 RepID=UPI00289CA24D|nr:uncharacterized protein LOC132283697 [Cornus florida]